MSDELGPQLPPPEERGPNLLDAVPRSPHGRRDEDSEESEEAYRERVRGSTPSGETRPLA